MNTENLKNRNFTLIVLGTFLFCFSSCGPKLFTTYKENGKKQEKIDLDKLNEYIRQKSNPFFEKSPDWSSKYDSTGHYLFTSKNGKIKISVTKKDGVFTFLKKIEKLDKAYIVSEYNFNGNIKSKDTVFFFPNPNKKKHIVIDTIQFNFKLKDIANITSFVPQIENGINSVAQKRINQDLKTYFQATSIEQDSADYVKDILTYYDVKSLKEYSQIIEQKKQSNPYFKLWNPYFINGDELEENFNIEYLSQNLLNVTVSTQILPYKGRYQFFFESAFYDLRTGNKLEFNDFFKIPSDSLIKIFNSEGYRFRWDDETLNTTKQKIKEPIWIDNICPVFYFNKIDSKIYLMIKTLCTGPQLLDFGIPLSELKTYIEYPEFKNKLNLWGKDIYSLIGYDYNKLGREIQFEDYRIKFIGAHLVDNKSSPEFAIARYYKSAKEQFFLYLKTIDDKLFVVDILEIQTTGFKNPKIVEYCYTEDGIKPGIIAIVEDKNKNQEFYYEILKAWKANPRTEKFENIEINKIKKCPNQSNW